MHMDGVAGAAAMGAVAVAGNVVEEVEEEKKEEKESSTTVLIATWTTTPLRSVGDSPPLAVVVGTPGGYPQKRLRGHAPTVPCLGISGTNASHENEQSKPTAFKITTPPERSRILVLRQ